MQSQKKRRKKVKKELDSPVNLRYYREKMNNINKLKNGSLYKNKAKDKTERVVGRLNSQRVWTQFHKEPVEATPIKDLEIAAQEEVDNYLK